MKTAVQSYFFWLGAVLTWETVLHLAVFSNMDHFSPAFSLAAAALLAALTGLQGWTGLTLRGLLPGALFLLYAVQMVYFHIFQALLSLAYVSMGGAALATFWPIALEAIRQCAPRLLLLALPAAAFYLLAAWDQMFWVLRERHCLGLLAAAALLWAGAVSTLPLLGGTGVNTPYAAYYSTTATVDRWADRFGLLTAQVKDLHRLLGGRRSGALETGLDLTAGGGGARNILQDMDFDALDRLTEDQDLLALDRYFASLAGTGKNAYSGFFQGNNLIVVCAEAFSPYLIDPELTPTLYRLSQEGFVFENFYNSFPSLTTNGEYSLCMGLMPDLSRMSFATSVSSYVPFCLGHQFAAGGGTPLAYHNNTGTFYDRINTHTNMGYTFRALGFGLDMEPGSPTSDLEMMEKTVDDYLNLEPFHAYYMTYSGHADYGFDVNAISEQNRDLVEGLEGSEPLLAYLACQLELERAMTYLLEQLEAAGIADRTVVVLTGDHLPYGLPDEDYVQLAGEAAETDPFWRYRNSFICWRGDMTEPVVVEDYCCTQDILPTLLNLFGFAYDSRLLTGRDVLSDCTHAALLKDGSFLTEEVSYDAVSGEFTWRTDTPDEDYAQALLQAMEEQFTLSAAILDTDYYDFVFTNLELLTGPIEHPDYASYADIEGTWYEADVELLTAQGALSGGGTGDFQGEQPASRGAFLAMLTRALQLSTGGLELPFEDVEPGQWYWEPVAAAWQAGWLEETAEFRPLETITRTEAIAFLTAAAQEAGIENAAAWGRETASKALAAQETGGAAAEKDTLTRGAAAFAAAELLRRLP